AHLRFDGSRDGLLDGWGVSADERSLNANFWRNDFGKLRNRQGDHRNDADENHQDGNDHRDDGAIDEEAIHALRKLQSPNSKLQIPKSKILELEIWCFSGAWSLELGIFPAHACLFSLSFGNSYGFGFT